MSVKGCEVCGGKVQPISDESMFGYCENCGIVYALKSRERADWSVGTPGTPRQGLSEETVKPRSASAAPRVDSDGSARNIGSRWRCPDCDAEMSADNDSDLAFLKREHITEYHPNRANP